jgi:hypothetical protein
MAGLSAWVRVVLLRSLHNAYNLMERLPGINQAIESAPLRKHGLEYVDMGDEYVVFKTEASEDKLIKVDRHTLALKILSTLNNRIHGEGGEDAYGTVPITAEERNKKDEYRAQERALIEVFGSEHVLKRGFFRFTIPVRAELARTLLTTSFGEEGRKLAEEFKDADILDVESIVETQPIAQELMYPDDHYTVTFSLPLLRDDNFKNAVDEQEGLGKIEATVRRSLDWHIQDLSAQPEYIEVEKEIVEKLIAYTKKTGLMIDVFGRNNITLFSDGAGKVEYHLIDPILPGSREFTARSIKDDPEHKLLRHYYTYYYGLKYLSERLGTADTLQKEDLIYFKK